MGNLLGNVIDSPPKAKSAQSAGTQREWAKLQIEIADTGVNLAHLKKIFQPFVQVDGVIAQPAAPGWGFRYAADWRA